MSAATTFGTETVYVYLLDEGVDVWRPVEAVPLGGGRYRLPDNPDPVDEHWEFAGGSTVIAERRALSDGPSLVAVAGVAPKPTTRLKALDPASR